MIERPTMDPYRRITARSSTSSADDVAPLPREEIVITLAILALGVLGIVIGLACDRPTEAGLGVAVTIFGAYTARALFRR